jgi:hypothetical protein
LAQKNITNFERGNITQYLIIEGLDVVWKSTLLADVDVSSFVEPSNVVGMPMRHCWQGDSPSNLYCDEVLATAIDDEMQ